jgi:hypothetical protein
MMTFFGSLAGAKAATYAAAGSAAAYTIRNTAWTSRSIQ